MVKSYLPKWALVMSRNSPPPPPPRFGRSTSDNPDANIHNLAPVARIMKTALPENAKIAKEAKECMQECVSEFISFITSEASEKCQQEKRKTVNGEDILFAMTSTGFENYAEALKIYLAKYRERGDNQGNQHRPSSSYGAAAVPPSTVTIGQNPQSATAYQGPDGGVDHILSPHGLDPSQEEGAYGTVYPPGATNNGPLRQRPGTATSSITVLNFAAGNLQGDSRKRNQANHVHLDSNFVHWKPRMRASTFHLQTDKNNLLPDLTSSFTRFQSSPALLLLHCVEAIPRVRKTRFPPRAMAPSATIDTVALTMQIAADTQIATVQSDRLSVNGVTARRSKAPKLAGGIAAHTCSDMYKSPGYGKPRAKRWDHRLSEESRARKPSSLKGATKFLANPGMISLGGGLPSSQYFPVERIDVKVPRVPHFTEEETKALGVIQEIGKHDIAEGKGIYDLHVALNYAMATGSAQMLRFLTEHTEIVHHPPYQDWQCTMTVGSTSALELAYRMFLTRGDYILTESYTFCTAAETARPLGAHWVGVAMDAEGLLPSSLDSILTHWDPHSHHNKPKPWLLYTVPSGQNPTGATQSLQRRQEIYHLAQKHDLFIIEDDPYYFLQMQPYTGPNAPAVPPPSSHEAFLNSLVPSLLSLDTDGRVIRLDSFSKVIAPGMRMGWITASEQIVERFIRHSEVSVQSPAGTSQIILFKLLEETWGHAGYLQWLINLRLEYTKRRDNLLQACEAYLPRDVASWSPPMAGMFLWIKIDWTKHPAYGSKPVLEVEEEIFHASIERGTLTSRGSWFCADADDPGHDIFFRTTFASAANDQAREAIRRFGEALRAVFDLEGGSSSDISRR
ncbi:MAG: hypothetical protein Q9163_006351 [Psora crenata]